uniref:Myb/SANT DNA binding domain containing 5 n=1 Tax=Sus scrofa TaxID=9823 RepID=A0A8W4FMU8_PIG
MEEVASQTEIAIHPEELEKGKETQGAENPSDQCFKPWSDYEIRSFLQEWELLECEKLRRNYHMASRIIARHLKQRGINKGRRKCLQMLINMHDLYWTIHEANQRPRHEPLPCPFGETLHRILGHREEDKNSGSPCAEEANFLPPEYQRPTYEEMLWAPAHVVYVEHPQVPRWEPWHMNSQPWLFPAYLPPNLSPQPQWSTFSD